MKNCAADACDFCHKGKGGQDGCSGEIYFQCLFSQITGKSKARVRVLVRVSKMSGKEQTTIPQAKSKRAKKKQTKQEHELDLN